MQEWYLRQELLTECLELCHENINILAISTSEIKLSVIIDEENTLRAVKKLHTIFDLD